MSLFDEMTAWSQLWAAWQRAAKGKRGRPGVAAFEHQAADKLMALQAALRADSWRPAGYHHFMVREPKPRKISAAPFADRVVHHALVAALEPLLEPRMSPASHANRKGRGTHAALAAVQAHCRRYGWVLRGDVVQHFPAMDHVLMLSKLARFVPDAQVLRLAALILASGDGVLADQYTPHFFAGDDLLDSTRPRGLPIGNLTSQFWSNVYLSDFDHFVQRQLGCRAYVRYVDDFALFDNDPARLQAWRALLIERMAQERLTLHERSFAPHPVAQGVPWLGFVQYPTHRRLKRRNAVAFTRRLRGDLLAWACGALGKEELDARVLGWIAHAQQGQTWRLREQVFEAHPWPVRTA